MLKNARQEVFAQNVASGMSNRDAYIKAGYSDHLTGKSTIEMASRLRKKHQIAARIAELLEQRQEADEKSTALAIERAIEKVALTKEYVITRLMENAERAMQAVPVKNAKGEETGVYRYEGSVANRALELLGKELGLFVDRKEVGAPGEFADVDARTLRQAIAERLGVAQPSDRKAGLSGGEGILRGESHKLH